MIASICRTWITPYVYLEQYVNQHSQIVDTQNERFGVPSQYRKCGDGLQWETSIAYEMLQSLLYIYSTDVRCSWQHLHATYGSHLVIFAE